jgi:hypothetical protein
MKAEWSAVIKESGSQSRGEMIARFIESSQSDQRDRRVHGVALRIRSERKHALVGG